MKRGELWTISGGPGFAGKPQPALIVQADAVPKGSAVAICPVTGNENEATPWRQAVAAEPANGLYGPSHLMIDKLTTIPRSRLGKRIGTLTAGDMARVDRALLVFLGLVG